MKNLLENIFHTKIGQRNVKTAICVFICIFLFSLFGDGSSIYACISALICLQDTVENSVEMGKHRILGTILGAFIGLIYLYIINIIPSLPNSLYAMFISLGIVFIIFILNAFKKTDTISICCVVFLIITLNYNQVDAYYYALERTVDTLIGIVVAIVVNKYFDIEVYKKIIEKIKALRK